MTGLRLISKIRFFENVTIYFREDITHGSQTKKNMHKTKKKKGYVLLVYPSTPQKRPRKFKQKKYLKV